MVGMRWNQPWNFSRLPKHLTEHRMEGGRIVTLWAALTVLDAVREYRGPGVLPGALYALRYMSYESAIRHPCRAGVAETPRDEDIPSQGQDTRLVTESVVRDPLLLVRLQKRLDTWTHPWTCIALVLYMEVMAAVKS